MLVRGAIARIVHALGVGQVTLIDDSGPVQMLQVKGPPGTIETPSFNDSVPYVFHYGFSSSAPNLAAVIYYRLFGNRSMTVVFGSNDPASRPKNLTQGDVTLYSARGQKVWLASDGLHIDGGGLPLIIENVGQQVSMDATLTCTGDVIANGGSVPISLATHVHPLTGGPETGAPLPTAGDPPLTPPS